jgi:hypothetical protein
VTLDFAGRQVIEDNDSAGRNMYDVNDDVIQEIYFGAKPKINSSQQEDLADLVNPSISVPSPKVFFFWKGSVNHSILKGGIGMIYVEISLQC